MVKMPINLLFVIVFNVKIQNKATNLSFCVFFVSIKLPRQDNPKNNDRFNDTKFFLSCCTVSCRWSKKVLPQTLALKCLFKPRLLLNN